MKKFKVNNKIEIMNSNKDKLIGLIQDIKDNSINVSVPADDKEFKLLRVKENISGIIYGENLLGFNAIVTNRYNDYAPTYELSIISNFNIIQRREYVRVPCSLMVFYSNNKYLLNINRNNKKSEDLKKEISKYMNEGIISDLSAGGIKMVSNKEFLFDENLLLMFNINDDIIITKGKILYKNIKIVLKSRKYIYGISFEDIPIEQKETIVNHIFKLMRKQVRK